MLKTGLPLLAVGLLLGSVCAGFWMSRSVSAASPHFDAPFQAVLLDSGQVYYGKISGLETPFPVLRSVYYIQTATDSQTKQVSNILIRRGNEWHGPEQTVLNARHIIMVEPVGPNSKVAQLIADQERKK